MVSLLFIGFVYLVEKFLLRQSFPHRVYVRAFVLQNWLQSHTAILKMAFNFNKTQKDLSNYGIADDNYYKSYVYYVPHMQVEREMRKTIKKVQIPEITVFVIPYNLGKRANVCASAFTMLVKNFSRRNYRVGITKLGIECIY